jgi:POT family proton-dependent oligopeptide transporter
VNTKQTNHPSSLLIFFATEMWERYGYYVVQTLLALYLALHFNWPDKKIYSLVGSFTALTYLSPLVGGWIADHLLGQKRAILMGTLVLLMSYLGLSLTNSDEFLNLSLAGIAVGTGLLKPNISSLLGHEYPTGSPHREHGFMIFYMGLTCGIILGTTLPSYVNEHFGWPASFMSAVIGMLIATSIFTYGMIRYQIHDYQPHIFSFNRLMRAIVLMALLWLSACYILNYPTIADLAFCIVVLCSIGYFIHCVRNESGFQSRQTVVLGLLCLISVMFWAFYFQMFLSLTLFIARVVQPDLFGIEFPAPYYVGIQSVGMIMLGLVLLQGKQSSSPIQPGISIGNKFLYAMCAMTLAYGLIVLVCQMGLHAGLLSPLYIIPAYLIISLAEMLLSPVGLSAVTMLACPKKVSTFMGIFFASLGVGAFLSGKLAAITAVPVGSSLVTNLNAHYATGFYRLLCILLAATLLSAILNRIVLHLMRPHGVIMKCIDVDKR